MSRELHGKVGGGARRRDEQCGFCGAAIGAPCVEVEFDEPADLSAVTPPDGASDEYIKGFDAGRVYMLAAADSPTPSQSADKPERCPKCKSNLVPDVALNSGWLYCESCDDAWKQNFEVNEKMSALDHLNMIESWIKGNAPEMWMKEKAIMVHVDALRAALATPATTEDK